MSAPTTRRPKSTGKTMATRTKIAGMVEEALREYADEVSEAADLARKQAEYAVATHISDLTIAAAKLTGADMRDVLTQGQPGRGDKAVRTRWAVWLVLEAEGMGSSQIGALTGRDHTTVIYGLKRAKADPESVAIAAQIARDVEPGAA